MPEQPQLHDGATAGLNGRWFGVYPAIVTDIVDPDGQGRVRIRLPWSPDTNSSSYEAWARLATLMAGNNRGSWFIPDVEDEVLVMFEAGNPRRPYVIGALWNGRDTPPESMDGGGRNYIKTIRSRNGVRISMDDTDGQETVTVETPGGQKVVLKDGPGSVEVADSNGNSLKMEASGVTLMASGTLTVQASSITMSAGSVTVNAGASTFSGTVNVVTLNASSVLSASYSPGAGNIW